MTTEIPLGGNLTDVVRVGDTVRRPWHRWSDAVHGVLDHLEAVGFTDVPRFFGRDEQGREVLSYVEGEVATRPWPAALRTTAGIAELGALVRRFHDAVATYEPPPGAEWLTGQRAMEPGWIVTHGDLGPWNVVFREGRPVGFIDFDFAEPAHPLTEVANVALFAVPLRDDDNARACGFDAPPDRRARLEALAGAYGTDDLPAVFDHLEAHLELDVQRTAELGPQGVHPWAYFLDIGNVEDGRERLAWVRAHRAALGG